MDFYSIASGSSGNCIYIGTDQCSVLIDAPDNAKKQACPCVSSLNR